MREVAIVSPVRTAVGNFGGGLKDIPAAELGATVIKAVLERTGLDPNKIDEVILGHGYPNGEEPAIGRLCALKADLPIEVPGYQLDRRCSSGLQSILNACMMVQTGNADVVLAGGVESMSRVEFYTTDMRGGSRLGSVTLHDRLTRARATASPEERFGVISGMIETAENLAERHQISRQEQDAYALRSHQRAVAAVESGKFAEEIVPILVPQRRGEPIRFQTDEGPPQRHLPGGVGTPTPDHLGGYRHSRQCQCAKRCGLGVSGRGRRSVRRPGPQAHGLPARLGRGRRTPGVYGDWASACRGKSLRSHRVDLG